MGSSPTGSNAFKLVHRFATSYKSTSSKEPHIGHAIPAITFSSFRIAAMQPLGFRTGTSPLGASSTSSLEDNVCTDVVLRYSLAG